MTLKANQKRLLTLIKRLKLPLNPVEVREHLEKLSDEEVKVLIERYQVVKDYRDVKTKLARVADPSRFSKKQKEYLKKLNELDQKYLKDMEGLQRESDEQLDKLEEKEREEVEAMVTKHDDEIDTLIEIQRGLYSRANSIVDKAQKGK